MDDWHDFHQLMKERRSDRHREWWDSNTNEIAASGVPYTVANNGESYLFRQPGKPKVDFYPSTGRWRAAGNQRTFSGGAKAFLSWYAKQGE